MYRNQTPPPSAGGDSREAVRGARSLQALLPVLFLLFISCTGTAAVTGGDPSEAETASTGTAGAVDTLRDGQEGTLHIHYLSASAEYRSEELLEKLQHLFRQQYPDVRITASPGEDAGSDLPDIDKLAEADLMIVFARRMTLPQEQLDVILRHIGQEKPVVGIRTASHAFQDFLELDPQVFGGDYSGHGDDEPVRLTVAEGAEDHPVLGGVRPWDRPGKIYYNSRLGPATQVLLYAEGLDSGIHEPVAWTNRYGENGRAFYTSMGLPSDFESGAFIRLILNAIEWTTGAPLR